MVRKSLTHVHSTAPATKKQKATALGMVSLESWWNLQQNTGCTRFWQLFWPYFFPNFMFYHKFWRQKNKFRNRVHSVFCGKFYQLSNGTVPKAVSSCFFVAGAVEWTYVGSQIDENRAKNMLLICIVNSPRVRRQPWNCLLTSTSSSTSQPKNSGTIEKQKSELTNNVNTCVGTWWFLNSWLMVTKDT